MAKKKAGHRSWAAKSAPIPGGHCGDIMSPEKRSALMSRIRGKHTQPEEIITKSLRARKICFRTHAKDLPGQPDIVFRKAKLAVFIDGDFWHGWRFPLWEGKLSAKWREKIASNRERDQRNFRKLRRMRWKVMRIWEHQIENEPEACVQTILRACQDQLAILLGGRSSCDSIWEYRHRNKKK
jgi:DNA mismatch endonuclease (patch repair protein)